MPSTCTNYAHTLKRNKSVYESTMNDTLSIMVFSITLSFLSLSSLLLSHVKLINKLIKIAKQKTPFPNNYSESRLWTWPHTQWQTSRCHGSVKLSPHPGWDRLVRNWPPGDWATLSLGSISHPDFLSCQDYISNYNLTRSKWTPMHPSDWKASECDVKEPPLINNTSGRISSMQTWMKSDGLKAQSY